MERLLEIGFRPSGQWNLVNNELNLDLFSNQNSTNILYSFIVNTIPMYFGISRNTFSNRMYQYLRPGLSQRTNRRIHENLKNALTNGANVEILLFCDTGLIRYGAFAVNLALGLEYTLIQQYTPEWNYAGNQRIIEINNNEELIENNQPADNSETLSIHHEFNIRIVGTYLHSGFINIPKEYTDLFGEEGSEISVEFNEILHDGKIYLRSNNGSPRIYIGKDLSDWINRNFQIGDLLRIVQENNRLKLSRII